MDISLKRINKYFSSFRALDEVSLDIQSGELIALLGPSGSGKTTLLRIIAGLEFADSGDVLFGEADMAGVPLRERQIGFVFQHYALFKHMSVRDNVGFGLQVRARGQRDSRARIQERSDELLELVQLAGLGERYPHQLSGGQRQRVALARALAIQPKVLLLDEPFGALDAKVRKELRQWLRELHVQTGVTTIFVTHDQEEALELADRVVIMEKGTIAQVDTVDRVYEHPASPFVFDFMGSTNIIAAVLQGREVFLDGKRIVTLTDSILPSGPVDIYVRPGDLRATGEHNEGFEVTVRAVHRTGPLVRANVRLTSNGVSLAVELPHLHHDVPRFRVGSRLYLRPMQYSIFPHTARPPVRDMVAPPMLIGRERVRGALP